MEKLFFSAIILVISVIALILNYCNNKDRKILNKLKQDKVGKLFKLKNIPVVVRVLDIKDGFSESDSINSALVLNSDNSGNAFMIPVVMLEDTPQEN